MTRAALSLEVYGSTLARRGPIAGFAQHRPWESVVDAMRAAVDRGARCAALGWTAGGHPIFALELGPPDAQRISVAVAGIHAMEWIGVATLLAAIDRLFEAVPSDRRILAVPVVNVDGYLQVEDDLRAGRRAFRRGNAHGVDLNRNWPTNFRNDAPLARVLPRVFASGPAPLSEPETAAITKRLDDEARHGAQIARAVSLHSFGRKVLFPWGSRWREPAAAARLKASATAMQRGIAEPYGVTQSARWVPGAFAYGMEIDHFYAAYGANALLVECSAGGFRWNHPTTWTRPFQWFNPPDPAASAIDLSAAVAEFLAGRDGVPDRATGARPAVVPSYV